MKLNKLITIFAFATIMLFSSISVANAYHNGHNYAHDRTQISVYDYAYDYDSNYWTRVNTYADYVSCRQARRLIVKLRRSGFYVVVDGPRVCPRRISYGVYHNVFWVNNYGFYSHWSTYHYNFHHHFTRVHFHNHRYHNQRHYYGVYGHKHYAKTYYKSHVKKKYKKWKKNNYNSIPSYGKKSVTYKTSRAGISNGTKAKNKTKKSKNGTTKQGRDNSQKMGNKNKKSRNRMNRSSRPKSKNVTRSRNQRRQRNSEARRTRTNRSPRANASNGRTKRLNNSASNGRTKRLNNSASTKRSSVKHNRKSNNRRGHHRSSRRPIHRR